MTMYRRDPERELHLLRAELEDLRTTLKAVRAPAWGVPPRWLSGSAAAMAALAAASNLHIGLWGTGSLSQTLSAVGAWGLVAVFHLRDYKRAPKSAKGH